MDYKASIEKIRARIRSNDETVENQIAVVGEQLAGTDPASVEDAQLSELLTKIADLREAVDKKRETVSTWRDLEKQERELREEIDQIDAQVSGKRREIEPAYESVGDAALDLYESSAGTHPELEQALAGLLSVEQDIREKERRLQQLESSSKPDSFLSKTFAKGKGMVIRGTLKTKGLRRTRNLKEAGQRICEGELPDVPDGTRLGKELLPVRAAKQDIAELHRRRESVTAQMGEVKDAMVEIEKQERMRSPAANLEHDIKRLNGEIDQLKSELGRRYVDSGATPESDTGKLPDALRTIEEYRSQNAELEKLVSRLEAGVEAERIDAQISAQKKRREELQDRIKQLDDEIAKLGDAASAQEKARGSEKTLEQAVGDAMGEEE